MSKLCALSFALRGNTRDKASTFSPCSINCWKLALECYAHRMHTWLQITFCAWKRDLWEIHQGIYVIMIWVQKRLRKILTPSFLCFDAHIGIVHVRKRILLKISTLFKDYMWQWLNSKNAPDKYTSSLLEINWKGLTVSCLEYPIFDSYIKIVQVRKGNVINFRVLVDQTLLW